jgi:hypothetical protein
MLELNPQRYIGMKASNTETGIVTIGIMADGICHRNIKMTQLTISI